MKKQFTCKEFLRKQRDFWVSNIKSFISDFKQGQIKKLLLKNGKSIGTVCIGFLLLIFANYFMNLQILKSSIDDLQTQTIKGASTNISLWLNGKINAIESINETMASVQASNHKYRFQAILKHEPKVTGFNQLFVAIDSEVVDFEELKENKKEQKVTQKLWYSKTLKNNKTTISFPHKDESIKTDVVFICTPRAKADKNIKGVLCGTLSLDNIKSKILNIPLPHDGVIFLTNEKDEIILHQNFQQLGQICKSPKTSEQVTINNETSKGFIYSYFKLNNPKWNVVLRLDKSKMHEKINDQLITNFIIYIISLVIFIILSIVYFWKYEKSEKKLLKSNQLIKSFVDYNEKGYLVIDNHRNITYYNQQFLDILNIKEHFIKNAHLAAEFTSSQNAHLSFEFSLFKNTHFLSGFSLFQSLQSWKYDSIFKMLDISEEKLKTWHTTFSYQHKKDDIHVSCTISPIIDEKKRYKGVALVLEDITCEEDLKRKEEEQKDLFIQQAKMADLGSMLGAISHQWRQPLAGLSMLLGNISQLKEMNVLDDETLQKHIDYALNNTKYLTQTIDTFQDFYKPHKEAHSFDIQKAIKDTNVVLEPHFKNLGIDIDIPVDGVQHKCFNYKNEFQQIIATLILNARDALLEKENGGIKTISVSIEEKEKEYHVKVADNGTGISAIVRLTLFQSFKTTKGEKGTGNGLYVSRLIAKKKLQGDLILSSFKDPTEFLLRMPKNIKHLKK